MFKKNIYNIFFFHKSLLFLISSVDYYIYFKKYICTTYLRTYYTQCFIRFSTSFESGAIADLKLNVFNRTCHTKTIQNIIVKILYRFLGTKVKCRTDDVGTINLVIFKNNYYNYRMFCNRWT